MHENRNRLADGIALPLGHNHTDVVMHGDSAITDMLARKLSKQPSD